MQVNCYHFYLTLLKIILYRKNTKKFIFQILISSPIKDEFLIKEIVIIDEIKDEKIKD